MRHSTFYLIGTMLVALCPAANASTFTFNTDPFAGTNILNIPGRQLVVGEAFLNFSTATDVFSFDSTAVGIGDTVHFVNALAANVPTGGVNMVVLQSLDNDNNPLTPFGEFNAADLIAGQITTPGPGLFIFFNQSLGLPRLVYSADLSSNTRT